MRHLILACLLFALMVRLASAGTLTEFEQDTAHPKDPAEKTDSGRGGRVHEGHSDDSFEAAMANLVVQAVAYGIGCGGTCSLDRASGRDNESRVSGEALIPIFRLDGSYQDVASDVRAFDLRGEAGYGPVGGQVRYTQYRERAPSETLSTTQAHLLYRMSFGSHVEMDLGAGFLTLDGRTQTSGFSFTFPILVHPSENYGFEFRPAWSTLNGNTLRDYDLAILLGRRYVSFKVGYRWLQSEHDSLNGPQAGLVVRW